MKWIEFCGGKKMIVVEFLLILSAWFVLIMSYIRMDFDFAKFYIPLDFGVILAFFGINGYLHNLEAKNGNKNGQ